VNSFWTEHISATGAPAWWIFGLIGIAFVLVLNYLGVRIAIRAMLTFAAIALVPMLLLGIVIVAKGGQGGNTCRCSTRSDLAVGNQPRRRARGVLLGILLFVGFEAAASIGEESHDPHRSIPRAVLATVAAAGCCSPSSPTRSRSATAMRRSRRRLGARSGGGRHARHQVHRVVVLDDPRPRRDPRRDRPALAICVTIGARLLRTRPRWAAAEGLRAHVAVRHAVGREPAGLASAAWA